MRSIITLATVTLMTFGLAGGAFAADYKSEYKLSTALGPPHPWGLGVEKFADLVRERTDGRINIKVYPGPVLAGGDSTKHVPMVRQGLIDFTVESSLSIAPHVPEFGIFNLPFFITNDKATDAVIRSSAGDKLFDALRGKGVEPLSWADNGIRQLTNSKRDIRSPEDMKGMKFRTVGSPMSIDTFRALGADPTQMSWTDAQPALATGAVDGHENSTAVLQMFDIWTLDQTHVTTWGAVADILVFSANPAVMDSFTPEDREIVVQAAREAGDYEIELVRALSAGGAFQKKLEENGVTVTNLTPEETAVFQERTRGVFDKWSKVIGVELVEEARQAIAAAQ